MPQTRATQALGPMPAVPPTMELANVPFFPQEEKYCGPASLAMTLAWTGDSVDQNAIASETFSPGREGTLASDLVGAARRHGRLAVPVETLPDLLREVAAGHPVLVFQNLGFDWYPIWHFAVVIGYDLNQGEVVLHSGADARRVMSLDRFERSWAGADHWGLVVLRSDTLPATGDESKVIQAAMGLERAGRSMDAAAAYRAALGKWPGSFGAAIGLGNSLYASRNLPEAEQAFRQATRIRPEAAPAWNNLATVLADRGDIDPALYTARRAVETGQGAEPYRATLREIQIQAQRSSKKEGSPERRTRYKHLGGT